RRDAALAAPVEQRRDLRLVARLGYEVGRGREVAARAAHDVAIRLAVGMRRARVRLDRARRGETARRRDARCGQRDLLEARLGRELDRYAEALGERPRDPARLLLVRAVTLVAPAPELAARNRHSHLLP